MTVYWQDPYTTLHHGDVLDVLRELPSESVQCVVTSPPYWGLRSYGVDGQLGLEATPAEYVARMVEVFREVRRVLRSDGTCWVNLGDSYAGSWGNYGGQNRGNGTQRELTNGSSVHQPSYDGLEHWIPPTVSPPGLKPKDLVGIPWRVAFALQEDGWWLRSDIVWAKPNPMPESVTDRPTKAHEYIFLLTKQARYYYDADAVREAPASYERAGGSAAWTADSGHTNGIGSSTFHQMNPSGRNLRSVWTLATEAFPGAHFATFPSALPERCIKAGTSERGGCPECGAPWVRVVERTPYTPREVPVGTRFVDESRGDKTRKLSGAEYNQQARISTIGWRPGCKHEGAPVPCVVMDPFGGAMTTSMVAKRLGRKSISIDINEDYLKMGIARISAVPVPMWFTYDTIGSGTNGEAEIEPPSDREPTCQGEQAQLDLFQEGGCSLE